MDELEAGVEDDISKIVKSPFTKVMDDPDKEVRIIWCKIKLEVPVFFYFGNNDSVLLFSSQELENNKYSIVSEISQYLIPYLIENELI